MKKRLLIGLVVVLAVAATAAVVGANADGLVSYWPVDEGSGPTANDAVNGNNGTLVGDPQYTDVDKAPVVGNAYALDFDGNDYVRVPQSSTLEPTNVTVAAWVKASSSPGSCKYILSKGAQACVRASYGLYTGATGGLFFYIYSPSDAGVVSPGAGPSVWDGNWRHVAGTYNGSLVRLYVDGAEIGTGTATTGPGIQYGLSHSNDLLVGAYHDGCFLPFKGLIDEVGVWNRALSPDEIAALSVGIGLVDWLPPLALDEWTLNENATLPIKFRLHGAYDNPICTDLAPTMEVAGQTLNPRFDASECHYIANFRPDEPGIGLTARVYINGVEVGVSRPFDIVEAGTPNGRGRSK